MKILLGLLFYNIFLSHPFAKDSTQGQINALEGDIEITHFQYSDFSRNSFYVHININKEEIRQGYVNVEHQEIGFTIKIGDINTNLVLKSLEAFDNAPEKLKFQIYAPSAIEAGQYTVYLFDKHNRKLLSTFQYTMPKRLTNADEQPIVARIKPAGGVMGDTITFVGRNFGKDIEDIVIQYIDVDENIGLPYDESILTQNRPYYLSTPKEERGEQEIKFVIPSTIYHRKNLNLEPKGIERILGKSVNVKIYISGRPSTIYSITVLPRGWKLYTGILSIIVTILFLLILSLVIRKLNFFPFVLYEQETNMYSLSNFQAFTWTLTFIGSYFYVAISVGLLLKNGEMPIFHPSLIALLGISYGGLISANYVDGKSKNKLQKKGKPSFRDLFCNAEGQFNLPKFQLFGFTIISNAAYLFNLFQGNVLEGLPLIPESLHTLLLTSQGGFIGGQYVQDVVNKKGDLENEEQTDSLSDIIENKDTNKNINSKTKIKKK